MRLQTLAFLLSFAVLPLPLQGQEQQSESSLLSGALRKSGLPEDKESVTIPLNPTFSGFTVEVNIDGKPVQLILDTGAAGTLLSQKAAKRIGLKATTYDDTNVRDGSGTKLEVQHALTKRIKLGDAWTVNEPVLIAKLPDGIGDGLLGISTLADWDVRINPAEKTLTLFPGGKAQPLDDETEVRLICKLVNPEASSSNPQGLRAMNLRVPVRLGNHALVAVPDTGYGGILQLSSVLMKKFAPEAMTKASPALVKSIAASGRKASRTAKVPEFTFGPDALQDLHTEVADVVPGTGAEREGIIGLNLLRHYVMTFRFSAGELRLKPLGTVQEITRTSTAGLNLDFNSVIMSLDPDGPGAKVGLRAGDQLLEIEGLPLKTMKPAEFAAFKRLPPGTTVKISYRRGAAEPAEVNVVLIKE
jgi:predicted aspartyl protease